MRILQIQSIALEFQLALEAPNANISRRDKVSPKQFFPSWDVYRICNSRSTPFLGVSGSNVHPPFFVLKNVCCFTSAAYIQAHSWLDLIMKTNTMNPDQTAYKQSDLGYIVCNIDCIRT